MTTEDDLTKQQCKQIEQFLHLFADIENALKRRLRLPPNDKTGIGAMASRYLERNPYWSESASQLQLLSDIRNLLTHNRSTAHGYPVAVTRRSVEALGAIRERLLHPVTIAERFLKAVDCVSTDDSLGIVVTRAFDNGFSQFPVLANGQFVGLITENEIARWLGRRAKKHGPVINLDEVIVNTVIREKDPFAKGIPIFTFVAKDTPIEEVMGRFMARPMLEVVLLTKSGQQKEEIEGIVTQWDAARYPN